MASAKKIRVFKVVFLGDGNVGKTSLAKFYASEEHEEKRRTTIGIDNLEKYVKLKDDTVKLQIWDTAGTEQFKAIHSNCYHNANGIVLVYDITKQESFTNIDTFWIPEIEERRGLSKVQMVLIGNKLDQKHNREVSKEEGEKLHVKYKMQKFEEMSATKDPNTNRQLLEDTLTTLAQKMWEANLGSEETWSADLVDPKVSNRTLTPTKVKASKDRSCKC